MSEGEWPNPEEEWLDIRNGNHVDARNERRNSLNRFLNQVHGGRGFSRVQSAAKAVKALHKSSGREVWGHVVARLLNQLPTRPPTDVIERARVLDNYYVPARYPNGHVEGPAYEHYGSLHSSQALDHARAVIEYVRQALADG